MPTKKRVYPPGTKVYFPDKESQELFKRLKQDAKKYHTSISKLILYSVEYGLGYVEASFEDMKPKK